MKIPFGNLKVSSESRKYIEDCLRTSMVSGGSKVKQLEETWGDLFNYKYNLAVSNGTDADIAACMTLYDFGAKRFANEEIISPALAFAAVGNSIVAAGFKPVFVDIKRDTMNIDPEKIEEKITPKTKAIIATHTMGKPCDMEKIGEISEKYNLKVIEDCCEAHGGMYKGKYVGKWGDMATFSFYVAHIVSCGDGGMVSTDNEEIRNVLESIKYHGRKPGSLYFDHIRPGLNFRLNDLTASIGLPELKNFWEIFNKRKNNFYKLTEMTKDLQPFVHFVKEEEGEVISPHAFSLILKDPKFNYHKLYNFLETKDIQCKRNFGSMPTQHKAFKDLEYKLGDFPEAEYVGDNGLHFGIHQFLEEQDINYISDCLHEYFKKF